MKHSLAVTGLLACLSSCSLLSAPPSGGKQLLLQCVGALPDYCIYEESKPQFLDRLQTGYYWEEPSTTGPITCLWIGGDGCYGCRVFMLTPEQELYVLNDDWEDASRYDCLYHYNRSENCLKLIRDDVPKSILNVDAVAYPSRVWQTLFPER